WTQKYREGNLRHLTNNMRFLILPWVRVPHLASHILSRIASRISADWYQKYGHPQSSRHPVKR
ncbi:MAG: Druantia anti-phage system protein DruA, partial [Syntrophales bacterium]